MIQATQDSMASVKTLLLIEIYFKKKEFSKLIRIKFFHVFSNVKSFNVFLVNSYWLYVHSKKEKTMRVQPRNLLYRWTNLLENCGLTSSWIHK